MKVRIPTGVRAAAMAGLALAAPGTGQTEAGQRAPTLKLSDCRNGAPSSLQEVRGRLVMLSFFATW